MVISHVLRYILLPMSPDRTLVSMARPEGLEPPAYWFEANRSIQLSYGRGSGDRDLMVSSHRSALKWCRWIAIKSRPP
jgi:hypothetical protein